MPRGFSSIKNASKNFDDTERGPSILYLKLENDEDVAVIRALEEGDDVYFYNFHDFSGYEQNGWMTKIPCLDQDADGSVDCPGCEEELNRGFQGLMNVIWRDAPVFKRNDEGHFEKTKGGKVIQEGTADQLAVWRITFSLFQTLGKKDVKLKGLSSRDLEILRDGAKGDKKTKYHVEPADLDGGPQALSAADKKIAEGKYDLEEITRPVDAKTFQEIIDAKKKKASRSDDAEGEESAEDIGDFMKEKPFDSE